MVIKENMQWPPSNYLTYKMEEYAMWYSGDAELLANYYADAMTRNLRDLPYPVKADEMFWGRQIRNQGDIMVHVPIAGDIAETSANFLFGESPLVRFGDYKNEKQKELDDFLNGCGFFKKIIEAAESCSAIGGVYFKIAWDEELDNKPIIVVQQADRSIPEFAFGILKAVTFWKVIDVGSENEKVYRLLERYEKGSIKYALYLGTADRLGKKVDINSIEETYGLVDTDTHGEMLAIYVPNLLPNRLDRNSYLGRSDYSGIEGLMDSLDQAFTLWMRELALAQARVFIPEQYLSKSGGRSSFNIDKQMYVSLDADPVSGGEKITLSQFDIRADQFEKTTLNLIDRIVTSAGYSPQSFGLNIQDRAESGTALSIRERKSFATKGKKENYWQQALIRLVELLMFVSNTMFSTKFDLNNKINVTFSDGVTNNISELSTAVKLISDAKAASTSTKIRMLHPDWDEQQVLDEVKAITEENEPVPLDNPDTFQMQEGAQNEDDEDERDAKS